MDKYFYLISQFPELIFNKKSGVTVDSFFQQAAKWLGNNDYSILTGTCIKNGFLIEYNNFEQELQKDIAHWRKAKKNGTDYSGVQLPSTILGEGNPFDIELKLLTLRWDYLEGKSRNHHFDLESILIYSLKLKLLQRMLGFDNETGRKKYQLICEEQI